MMANCPECGKRHVVMWPELNPFRRDDRYYCSHGCWEISVNRDIRKIKEIALKRRKGRINMIAKITPTAKQKAVEMAIKGENPLAYLKKCGAKNPSASWQYIKSTLQKNNPDMFAKLPNKLPKTAGDAIAAMKDAADKFFGSCGLPSETPEQPTIKLDGAITIQAKDVGAVTVETPEGEYSTLPLHMAKIAKPVNYDGFDVDVIRSAATGVRYEVKDGMLYVKYGPDEFAMEIEDWQKLLAEIPRAAAVLGVEL